MSNDTDECGNGNYDMTYERVSQQTFFGTSALLFLTSATLTARWSTSMSSMGGMAMPGGWTMSMTWMRMPGQTWLSTAASFVGMWAVMMVAMMLPSLVPVLWRYRQTIGSPAETRTNWLIAAVALGYFFVWTTCGAAVFPIGTALARVGMQLPRLSRLVPIAVGVVVVIAGALQFTTWKSRQLRCFREPSVRNHLWPTDAVTAWRHGLCLGLHCVYGCAGLTVILLVIGVMDLRVMVLVTAAITAERLAPNGTRVARAVGIATVGVGLLMIVRAAAGLG